MSDKVKTGGPAFPVPEYEQHNGLIVGQQEGMSLRDYFAAKALQGMTSTPAFYEYKWEADDIVKHSYMLADAMIEARK